MMGSKYIITGKGVSAYEVLRVDSENSPCIDMW